MPDLSRVMELEGELRAASPALVGNAELLRGVLAGCGDCIKVLDLDGRLLFMSEGGKRVMEVEDFGALKGCPWPEFWAGEGNAEAVAAVAKAKAGNIYRFRAPANTAKGNPRFWDVQVSPIAGEDGRPSHLLSISRDITDEWESMQAREKHIDRQKFLTDELQHRVKNILSTVLAIANRTFRNFVHEEPRLLFAARVMTLSHAHDELTASKWDRTPIAGIVAAALKSHQFDDNTISTSGPELYLNPQQALALALAVNELATNATKYGAISGSAGHVDVTWGYDDTPPEPTFTFQWRESGGPPVKAPTHEGFGARVIKQSLANDFGGSVELAYPPSGLVCILTAPLQNLPRAQALLMEHM